MKLYLSLKHIIVYILIYSIKDSLIFVNSSGNFLSDDPTSRTPVGLDISDQKNTDHFKYTRSPGSLTHTFTVNDGFAIKDVVVTDKETGKSQHLWGSTAPSLNAYKVVGHSSGINSNDIEIHLFNKSIVTVHSSFFSSSSHQKSHDESTIIINEPIEQSISDKQDSLDSTSTSKINLKLLYIILPVVIGILALVVGVTIAFIHRRKLQNSHNLLSSETVV